MFFFKFYSRSTNNVNSFSTVNMNKKCSISCDIIFCKTVFVFFFELENEPNGGAVSVIGIEKNICTATFWYISFKLYLCIKGRK